MCVHIANKDVVCVQACLWMCIHTSNMLTLTPIPHPSFLFRSEVSSLTPSLPGSPPGSLLMTQVRQHHRVLLAQAQCLSLAKHSLWWDPRGSEMPLSPHIRGFYTYYRESRSCSQPLRWASGHLLSAPHLADRKLRLGESHNS